MQVSGIIATIDRSKFVDAGVGMAALWRYPEECRDTIPQPLHRLTVFNETDVVVSDYIFKDYMNAYPSDLLGHIVVTAEVRHIGYGVYEARNVIVTGIAELSEDYNITDLSV